VKEWEAPGMTRGYPGGGSRGVAGGPGTLLAHEPATFHGVLSNKGGAPATPRLPPPGYLAPPGWLPGWKPPGSHWNVCVS